MVAIAQVERASGDGDGCGRRSGGAREKVSEEVEKVADDIGDRLPEGKLRQAAIAVEDLADRTGKAAALADDLIEKVTTIISN